MTVEVDDVGAALGRCKKAKVPLEYRPVDDPRGVRRFFVRDPCGKLSDIFQHPGTAKRANEEPSR